MGGPFWVKNHAAAPSPPQLLLPEEYLLRLDTDAGRTVALICTNEALPELITGYYEGVIYSPEEITSLKIDEDAAEASVSLRHASTITGAAVQASGLGGDLLRSDAVMEVRPFRRTFREGYLCACAKIMDAKAVKYRGTGGVHCSTLFYGEKMLSVFENVGQHNTLDKLYGDCLLRGVSAEDSLLVTTGRISFDMVRKAAEMGISAIAYYTMPTMKVFEMAEEINLSLVGYLKKNPMIQRIYPRQVRGPAHRPVPLRAAFRLAQSVSRGDWINQIMWFC